MSHNMPPLLLLIAVAAGGVTLASATTLEACKPDGSSNACACTGVGGVVISVDCTTANLEEVPTGIPVTVTALNLAQNDLKHIRSQQFNNLPALESLQLQGNQLHTVESGAFVGLPQLSVLRMHDNSLQSLPAGLFSPLPGLKTLNVGGNGLNVLSATIFAGLNQLESLALNGNGLVIEDASAPTLFVDLVALTELNLSDNRLTGLHAQLLVGLTALRTLNLGRNLMVAVQPGALVGIAAVQTLDLSFNLLRGGVGDSLQQAALRQVATLTLAYNRMTSLPVGTLDDMDALKTL